MAQVFVRDTELDNVTYQGRRISGSALTTLYQHGKGQTAVAKVLGISGEPGMFGIFRRPCLSIDPHALLGKTLPGLTKCVMGCTILFIDNGIEAISDSTQRLF